MLSRKRRIILLLVASLLVLLIGGRMAAEFAVELLWYRSLALEEVFWTRWRAAAAVRVVGMLVIALFVFANLWVVARSLGSLRLRRRYGNIEIAERLPQSYIVGAATAIALFSSWWLSAAMPDPLTALAAVRHASWDLAEPLFGRDASFYVFVLPVLDRMQTLAGLVLFWTTLLVVAAYVASGAVKGVEGKISTTVAARRHLGIIAAAFFLVFAWDLWLDRYHLLLSGSGVGGALGYTDVNARLPGRMLAFWLALLAAGGVGWGAWSGTRRAPLLGVGALIIGGIGALTIYPALVQRLVVEPNEFPRESAYIQHHLNFARLGYDLGGLERSALPFQGSRSLEQEPVLDALAGVPLWDSRPLLSAFRQRQSLFPYYDFVSVHADRYGPADDAEQVAIAVRELETSELPPTAQTWQNLHLNYVSGVGAVVSPVSQMADDGAPVFYVWDLDPPKRAADAPASLHLDDSRVYFGQRSRGYVLLGPEHRPLGVALDASWKKLLFAWAFQSRNLLLANEVTTSHRVVYRRQVLERVRAVAPFLRFPFEGGAYPVIHDGRIVWIVDGFTTTISFPLAPLAMLDTSPVRYVRNSVKATLDAVTGEVAFYAMDAEDPILQTYSAWFPGLIRPFTDLPPDLQRHLRVPPPLLTLQAQVLGDYHLQDPRAFYEKEDVWSMATENYGDQPTLVEPTFVQLTLPGGESTEFVLVVPFVSRGRQNMTALLMARNDPPHYGERLLFELPRDELVPGPQQIESLIDQDPEISQQLALWRRGGSSVIRGHLVVVPLDSSLIYVEPLFLEADNAAIPQLERVIVAHGGRVSMAPTLSGAVAALTGGGRERPDPGRSLAAGVPGGTPQQEALERAQRLLEQADTQLRAGDWAGFGRTWNALREALRRSESATPPAGS